MYIPWILVILWSRDKLAVQLQLHSVQPAVGVGAPFPGPVHAGRLVLAHGVTLFFIAKPMDTLNAHLL